MGEHENIRRTFYHFSFLKDIRIHGMYVNSVERYLRQYPFILGPHLHDFYTILIITSGKGSLKICNDAYSAEKDTVFLIAPGQIHSFDNFNEVEGTILFFCQDYYVEEFSFIRLVNTFSYVSRFEDVLINERAAGLTGEEVVQIGEIFNSIRNEYYSCVMAAHSAVIIRSLINIMLLKISGLYGLKSGNDYTSDNRLIHSLSNLIESNFTREHQTGFYSSSLNISEKNLNDVCNRNFKCGLKKLLQDRLMQESRRLLLTTELTVTEIGYKLNFDDNSYFSKVFKRNTGLTPKRFREMHKKLLP